VGQRVGGLTAIDGLRTERMRADNVQSVRRQRLGNAQTTGLSAEFQERCVSAHVTASETLRGERMCANSERTYGDSVQGMHRQRKRRGQW
jgi:hypothetical protein